MQTVSIAEAAESLPEIIAKLNGEPVLIMRDGKIIAMISAPEAAEQERQKRWAKFLATSERVSAELEQNLAKDGISVEQFLEDVLRDES